MIFRKNFFLVIIFFLFGVTNVWSSEKIAFLDVEFIINKSEPALLIIKKIEKIRDQETKKLNQIENNLKKIIRYSEPVSDKETFFIWPESITSGAYYSDLLKYKNIIKENFSDKHFIILGTNTRSEDKRFIYNSFIVINNNLKII